MNMVIETGMVLSPWAAEHFFKIFLGVIFLNILQRRRESVVGRKRMATLYLAIAVLVLMVVAQLNVSYSGSDVYFVAAVIAAVLVVYRYREYAFPFRLRSPRDGRRYSMDEVLFVEDPDNQPETTETPETPEE